MATLLFDRQTDLRRRLMLLIAQAITLGFSAAVAFSVAYSLFLDTLGAVRLPWAYIVMGIFGSVVFYGFGDLQRRWPLARLSTVALAGFTLFYLLVWFGLFTVPSPVLPFALFVSVPLLLQIGFVILGGQAGRLFHVREIKRFFPWVVTGFVIGFVLGGVLVPPLIALFGGVEHLTAVVVVSCFAFLLAFIANVRANPAQLSGAPTTGGQAPQKPLLKLLGKRFVLLVFLYQMLVAMTERLTEYFLLSAAGARITSGEALGAFFGTFYAVLNGVDLLFLVLVAGFFLIRFGLRPALLANPLIMAVLFLAAFISGLSPGAENLLFALILLARVAYVTLNDGTTRSAVNAAYQALAPEERAPVQSGVEGVGVPLAFGLSGVLLLILNAIPTVALTDVILFAFLLTLAWAALGLLVYRGYSGALLQTLRRRAIDPFELAFDDNTSVTVLEALTRSDNGYEVRVGLDALRISERTSFMQQLLRLAQEGNPETRATALGYLERERLAESHDVIVGALEASEPAVRAAAIGAFCALEEADALEVVEHHLDDAPPPVRRAAMVGLLRYGGIPGILAAAERLSRWEGSTEETERQLAAEVIGDVGTAQLYRPLLALGADPSPVVRRAALRAAAHLGHARTIPTIIENLGPVASRSAALDALPAFGDQLLPFVEQALSDAGTYIPPDARRLVRACAQICTPATTSLLSQHIDHPLPELRQQVLLSLQRCGYRADAAAAQRVRQQLRLEVATAAEILEAGHDLDQSAELQPLRDALNAALAEVRQRIFFLLSFLYDSRAIQQAERQFERGDAAAKALAQELFDVTLSGTDKTLVTPFLDPHHSGKERAQSLRREVAAEHLTQPERLQHLLVAPPDVAGQSWLQACALYAIGSLQYVDRVEAVRTAATHENAIVRETARWAIERFTGGGGS